MIHSQLEEQLKRAAELAPFFDQLRSCRDAKDLFQRIVDIGRDSEEGAGKAEKGAISSLGKNRTLKRQQF